MAQIWVKFDLNYAGDVVQNENLNAYERPAYVTSIGGHTVPVYVPWAQPWYWPDTPQEFIVTPAQGSSYPLGGVSGYYLNISRVLLGSYYKSGAGPDSPNFPYHQEYPLMTSTAVAVSLTQPAEPTPAIITITRYDDFSQVNRSWSFLDYVWRLVTYSPDILFTENADTKDFNLLSTADKATIANLASSTSALYLLDALGGNDTVELPSLANANQSLGGGKTLNWDFTRTFNAGPGDDTLSGQDGNDIIDGGEDNDTVEYKTPGGSGSYTVDKNTVFDDTRNHITVEVGTTDYDVFRIPGTQNQVSVVSGHGGTDTIRNVEQARFDNKTVSFNQYRFVATRNEDGTGKLEFFVNGVLFDSETSQAGADVSRSIGSSGNLVSPAAHAFAFDDVTPIPAGFYEAVFRTNRNGSADCIELLNVDAGDDDVPTRFSIQLHVGNYSTDSEGCFVATGTGFLSAVFAKIRADNPGIAATPVNYTNAATVGSVNFIPLPFNIQFEVTGAWEAPRIHAAAQTVRSTTSVQQIEVKLDRAVSKDVLVYVDIERGGASLIGSGITLSSKHVAGYGGYSVLIKEGQTKGYLDITNVAASLAASVQPLTLELEDYRIVNVNSAGNKSLYREDALPNQDRVGAGLLLDSDDMQVALTLTPGKNAGILWRNTNGSSSLWEMNGAVADAKATLDTVSSAWTMSASGDFNGDGKADIVWRHSDGRVNLWEMDGGTALAKSAFGNTVNTAWKILGSGDFDGDGDADLVWRHTDGTVSIWQMDGPTVTSKTTLASQFSTAWKLASAGDFDGDGKDDLLWRHSDGRVAIWQMDGATPTAKLSTSSAATAWHVTGTGDFNGDGKEDILWRHDNGSVAIWHMNGATVLLKDTILTSLDTQWVDAGVGDYNGDGNADILYRHANTGQVRLWEMDGNTIHANLPVGTVSNNWQMFKEGFEFV